MKASESTEIAVRTVMDRLADVYVTRDAGVLATIFAPDADVVMYTPGADAVIGIAAIQAKATSDWARTEAATLAYRRTSISAAGQVAWVATDADFTVTAGGQTSTTPVRITFVLEERAGDWIIVHAHYSLAPATSGG